MSNFHLLFYIRKQKNYKGGAMPIYMRITVRGKRADISVGRDCDPAKWNNHAGRAIGTKEEIKALNNYLDSLQAKLRNAHQVCWKNKTVFAPYRQNRISEPFICKTMNKTLNLNKFEKNGGLSIFINAKHELIGVLIPLEQWKKIAPTVDKNSELHQLMDQLTFKPIFERSLKEQNNWLDQEIEQVEAEHLQKGLYNIYQDNIYCKDKDVFIHQYTDHRELVKVNADTGQTQTIRRNF